MESPTRPSESFVARFETLAGTSTKRRADVELRILDVAFVLLFGIVAVPLGLVLAAIVAATCGLPVIYRGERVGRGGRSDRAAGARGAARANGSEARRRVA